MLNPLPTVAAEAADRANRSSGFTSNASWTAGERISAWSRLWATLFDAVTATPTDIAADGAA